MQPYRRAVYLLRIEFSTGRELKLEERSAAVAWALAESTDMKTLRSFEPGKGWRVFLDLAKKEIDNGGKPVATVFLSLVPSRGGTLLIRGPSGADAVAAVRHEVAAIDSHLTVFNIRSMREHLGQFTAYIQFATTLYGGIGLFGLILASIGLAGVTAYSVAQRRKEIGIRMALGARNSQVLWLVLREGAVLVALGSLLGFAGAFIISRALSAMTADLARTFGDGTHDPFLLIGAPLLLGSLAMLACYLPARRATRIDPLTVLREE